MMESILKSLSMRAFIEDCQHHLAKIFGCQRVNMILVDRPRRQLFRIKFEKRVLYREQYYKGEMEQMPYTLEADFMESFPIEESANNFIKTGLAGYVARTYFSLLSDRISDDNRFVPYIDDP
jgi:hypothetical protein